MTALVRSKLIPLLNTIQAKNNPNTGLLIQRGLRVWQSSDKEKKDKKDLIEVIGDIKPSDLYQLAFDRWLLQTQKSDSFACIPATLDGRLMTGLALGGTLETGVSTHHSYGMPLLSGSSVKGAVRAYAEHLFSLKDAEGKIILEKDQKGGERTCIDPSMKPILEALFGADEDADQADAGYLVWHDAWFIPVLTKEGHYSSSDEAKPFVEDIVTVHHPAYYAAKSGNTEALDMESPVPNQQLSVQGSFYFVIEGMNKQWIDFAKQLLENMLQQFGMGAKGAAGYGYFKPNDQIQGLVSLLKKRLVILQSGLMNDADDPFAKLNLHLTNMSEKDLVESLSKNLNKFLKEFDLDKSNGQHCEAIVAIVISAHNDLVESWSGQSGNKERAYKFIQKYKA